MSDECENQTLPRTQEPESAEIKASEYLTLRVKELTYGIPIELVREIRGWNKPTPLPNTPEFLRGVTNLRGVVLPILDLSMRLTGSSTEENQRSVVIVCEYAGQISGLLVDAVSDIVSFKVSDIQPPPEQSGAHTSEFINGLAEAETEFVRLLNVATVIEPQIERVA